jgi:hypothetical protein
MRITSLLRVRTEPSTPATHRSITIDFDAAQVLGRGVGEGRARAHETREHAAPGVVEKLAQPRLG